MKVNIGCGAVYRKGFVNIDAFDDSVADILMAACNLDFDDSSVEYIECSHVLEHMGAVKGVYALSEFYRVLKPGGILRIATPDIEQAFQNFTWKEYEDRKFLMNWIYGLDIPGMHHRYGYPEELLRETLSETGFVEIKTKKNVQQSNYPELIAKCKKPLLSDSFDLISRLRHKLVTNNILILDDQVTGLDQDRIVRRLIEVILELSPNAELPEYVITDTCIESPTICLTFLRLLRDNGYPITKDRIDIVEGLCELDFPSILAFLLGELPITYGLQDELFGHILDIARKSITKLFTTGHSESTMVQLRETYASIKDPVRLPLFSEEAIQRAARTFLSQA